MSEGAGCEGACLLYVVIGVGIITAVSYAVVKLIA